MLRRPPELLRIATYFVTLPGNSATDFEKNQSTVRFEIFKVRAYMLQCNTASSQATTDSKHERMQQFFGQNFTMEFDRGWLQLL